MGSIDGESILNRDTIAATVIWILLTVVGELAFLSTDIFPEPASSQGQFIDEAFVLLVVLAIPVFAIVVVVLLYSAIKFRSRSSNLEDSQPVRTHGKWVNFWLLWTTILCLVVIVHPGYTGLVEIRKTAAAEPDLIVHVTGTKGWVWTYKYDYEYQGREREYVDVELSTPGEVLVLPNEALIRFYVTSEDDGVLHSFWVPAFRMKIDAVPGLITSMDVNTNLIGDYDDDVNFRVQCAELCGINHSLMSTPIRVVEPAEFEKWIADKAG